MSRLIMAHDKFAYDIGVDYGAATDSRVQGDLLSGLCEGIAKSCGALLETQLYYVGRELTPTAKKVLTSLAEMIKEEA